MDAGEFAGIELANKMLLESLRLVNRIREKYPDGVADLVTPEQRAELETLEEAIAKEMP